LVARGGTTCTLVLSILYTVMNIDTSHLKIEEQVKCAGNCFAQHGEQNTPRMIERQCFSSMEHIFLVFAATLTVPILLAPQTGVQFHKRFLLFSNMVRSCFRIIQAHVLREVVVYSTNLPACVLTKS
ncbi:unnamed protein product, partial [Ixodes persulcatus]